MTTVTIRVGGRDYRVACDDGQEEQLRLLADDVDDRVQALTFGMEQNPGEGMTLLLAALTMADELIELKKENEDLACGQGKVVTIADEARIRELEATMAATLDEVASRLEKIAEQV